MNAKCLRCGETITIGSGDGTKQLEYCRWCWTPEEEEKEKEKHLKAIDIWDPSKKKASSLVDKIYPIPVREKPKKFVTVSLSTKVVVGLTPFGVDVVGQEGELELGSSMVGDDPPRLICSMEFLMRVFGPYLYGGPAVFISGIDIEVSK